MRRREVISAGVMGLLGGCMRALGAPESNRSTSLTPESRTQRTPIPVTPEGELSTPTPEETETPTPTESEPTGHPLVRAAKEYLRDAVSAYIDQAPADASTLIDVNASVEDFSVVKVLSQTNQASKVIDRLEKRDTDVPVETVTALRSVTHFISYSARTQSNLGEAYHDGTKAVEYIESELFGPAQAFLAVMESEVDSAERTLGLLEERSTRGSMSQLDVLSPEGYDRKVSQFKDEIAAFRALNTAIYEYGNALEEFSEVMDDYRDGDGQPPSFDSIGFDDTVDTLNEAPKPKSLAEHFASLKCRATAYANASDNFQEAVEFREEGNDRMAVNREEDARQALDAVDQC